MILLNTVPSPSQLLQSIHKCWELSGQKINAIAKNYDREKGSPVFTINGQYTSRGWTEWTQGFEFGSSILQFDATGEKPFLDYGRSETVRVMASHVSHTGVHDHGFNNVSTYGNLLRLMAEGKIPGNEWERKFYQLAIKISGAVQAGRWTKIKNGGFIHSFNGPHSLFVDTIRSCRALVLSFRLGHVMQGEGDQQISLLERVILHMKATAEYSVFYGEGRDSYDAWGRTAHESIFNTSDGNFRCPNSQQGYSGFTTWTRGLAWVMCGFAEELEWMETLDGNALEEVGDKDEVLKFMLQAAKATCDFYIANSCTDGIPYWDTGAPGLVYMGDYLNKTADPFNEYEPVDSSAAAIAAQGLLRLGRYLQMKGEDEIASRYWNAGMITANTLLSEPYLSTDSSHQGLLLHSVYHRPNNWDHIAEGQKIPNGESSMWGDYHLRELCIYLQRVLEDGSYYTFFNGIE